MMRRPTMWLMINVATVAISVLVIVVIRPSLGIDFTGGSLLEIETSASAASVRALLQSTPATGATVQTTDSGTVLIRTVPLDDAAHAAVTEALRAAEVLQAELRFESIGPTIGAELRRKAWLAIGAAVVVLVVYLAYTFRQASGLVSSWKFGVAAIGAVIHDLLVVTAVFSVLSHYTSATIDTLFVTALLAILGYSVNDTIVLFNRFKEDWLASRTGELLSILDGATQATIIRSLNTSLTTLVVLSALLLFGGTTIQWFVAALAVGTIVGTYSSLFVAPPALYALAKR